ncbi:MAG: T9SS type A sorting domain-containing protein, partial [Bacteroidales bacterium]
TDDSGLEVIDGKQFLVTMYPNPATSTTKLVVSGVEGETDIDINDVQGKLIYKTTAKAMNGKVEQTIDVNNFAKGVYYVRIQNQTTSRTQKLIVLY